MVIEDVGAAFDGVPTLVQLGVVWGHRTIDAMREAMNPDRISVPFIVCPNPRRITVLHQRPGLIEGGS